MKLRFFLPVIITALCASSCIKDEWTKPAEVHFIFSMNGKASVEKKKQTFLEFEEGYMNISRISFEGYREAGEDFFFDSDFEAVVEANLAAATSNPPVVFDIPQGIYDYIKLRLELDSASHEFSLTLLGIYHSPNPFKGDIPVEFTLLLPEIVEVAPKAANDQEPITFLKDKINQIEIQLDPGILFQLVNSAVLESADITYPDGEAHIFISETENENIYNLVVNRLDKSTEAWVY